MSTNIQSPFSNAGVGSLTAADSSITVGGTAIAPTVALTTPVTVARGGTGDTSLTAFALLAGGTTSTGAVQSLAGLGTGGQVPTSVGAGALPVMAGPWNLASEPSGTLAARYSSAVIATSALASFNLTGQVAVASIGLPQGMLVSNLSMLFGSTAANGPTHFWMALLDSTLHVLAVSADNGSGALAANTFKTMAMGTPFTLTATGLYYIAASASASTTAPTAAGLTPAGAISGLTPTLCGSAGTQATPPALNAQLNSGTISGNASMNLNAWVS